MASTPSEPPIQIPALTTSQNTPSTDPNNNSLLETLSPLEQEVLDEYNRLLENLNNLNQLLSDLSETPSEEILQALRGLERKTSLVFTLLKASVYSIVLQQQIGEEDTGGGAAGSYGGSVGTLGG